MWWKTLPISWSDPAGMEREINQWPGVVTVGIFARHRASVCLLGTPSGVRFLDFSPEHAGKSA